MSLEIQVLPLLAIERHKNVVGLNRLLPDHSHCLRFLFTSVDIFVFRPDLENEVEVLILDKLKE
jgi:hypothetical protein